MGLVLGDFNITDTLANDATSSIGGSLSNFTSSAAPLTTSDLLSPDLFSTSNDWVTNLVPSTASGEFSTYLPSASSSDIWSQLFNVGTAGAQAFENIFKGVWSSKGAAPQQSRGSYHSNIPTGWILLGIGAVVLIFMVKK